MNLKGRLATLVRVVVSADHARCDVCGYCPESELKYEVSISGESDDGPDVCPGYGRPPILRLLFDGALAPQMPPKTPLWRQKAKRGPSPL